MINKENTIFPGTVFSGAQLIFLRVELSTKPFLFKIITKYKIFNLDDITTKNDNIDWPYRKLIIGPSGSGKTNYLPNSIQKDNNIIDKIYLYAKD